MNNDIIIGVDLAKNAFQLHGACGSGEVVFRKKLFRPQFHKFMTAQSNCLVAMEACSTSYYGARTLSVMGHEIRLIRPIYVNPFVKLNSTKSLYTWKAQFSQPRKQIIEATEQASEIRRLKKELARVSEERDILKKATAHFARDAK